MGWLLSPFACVIFVANHYSNPNFFSVLLFVTVFYYIGSCNRVLKNSSGKMSQRTKRMHFRFLKMLLFQVIFQIKKFKKKRIRLQVGIPLILIQLPIIIWGVKARFGLVWGGQGEADPVLSGDPIVSLNLASPAIKEISRLVKQISLYKISPH